MSPVEVPRGVDIGDVELTAGLRMTDKTVLASGVRGGRQVVVKMLRSEEAFWRERFRHECRIYRAFHECAPPMRVPQLQSTDGHRLLVLEQLNGQPVATQRYPSEPLTETVLNQVLKALGSFGLWQPQSRFPPLFDYSSRLARYAAGGWLSPADHDTLENLLAAAGPPTWSQHGDPLPSNLLLTPDGGCALVDFEFTARFVQGWDVAVLHTLLAGQPSAQRRVARYAGETWLNESAWLLNRAMTLASERRLHHELPHTSQGRQARVEMLDEQWRALRTELHSR